MGETPQHMVGKDMGCGFIGSIFGTRTRKPPVQRLEASKEHRRTQIPQNHTPKPPPRAHNHTTTAASKPIAKNPLLPSHTTAVKKPGNTKYDAISKNPLYNVSQVTNITYTKQLRKEPSFTSSELSLRISVRGKPNSTGLTYQAASNHVMVPGHLGNVMKKKHDNTKMYGNIYGNSPKKTNHEAFKNIGNERYKQGRFDEAIALYTEAIGMDSSIACYYSNRSAAFIGLGKLIDAILDCKIAIRIDPSYHRAHYRLASLYLRFGEAERALSHYKCSGEKAEKHDITNVQAVKAQLVTCSEARKNKDWKRLLKESQLAFSLGADSSLQVHAMQAEALLNHHRHEEACSGFQNAPVVDVNVSTQLFGLSITTSFLTVQARVYLASGRFDEAVSVALLASKLDQGNEVLNVARKTRALAKARANGNKIFKESQFSEACNVYTEGLEHEPYNSVLLCNRAACRYKLGQFERAVEDCTLALNLRPSYTKARIRRAQCNAKLERWEAAIQDYDMLNHETRGNEEVKRELLEARTQLKNQQLIDGHGHGHGHNKDEFGGLLIAV